MLQVIKIKYHKQLQQLKGCLKYKVREEGDRQQKNIEQDWDKKEREEEERGDHSKRPPERFPAFSIRAPVSPLSLFFASRSFHPSTYLQTHP